MQTLRLEYLTAEAIRHHRRFNVVGDEFEVEIGSGASCDGLCVAVDTIGQGWYAVESILAVHNELPAIVLETGEEIRESAFALMLARTVTA